MGIWIQLDLKTGPPPACKGLPKIVGVNVQSGTLVDPATGDVADGSLYHYGLGSQDSSDPVNCTFDGKVWEVVTTLRITTNCSFAPHRAFVSGLDIQHGSDLSGFQNWVPDVLAAPRLGTPPQPCVAEATQFLQWISPNPAQGAISLTQPMNMHRIEIKNDPTKRLVITTTSFGVQGTTTIGP